MTTISKILKENKIPKISKIEAIEYDIDKEFMYIMYSDRILKTPEVDIKLPVYVQSYLPKPAYVRGNIRIEASSFNLKFDVIDLYYDNLILDNSYYIHSVYVRDFKDKNRVCCDTIYNNLGHMKTMPSISVI